MYDIIIKNGLLNIYHAGNDTEISAMDTISTTLECERLVSRANRCDELEEALRDIMHVVEDLSNTLSVYE